MCSDAGPGLLMGSGEGYRCSALCVVDSFAHDIMIRDSVISGREICCIHAVYTHVKFTDSGTLFIAGQVCLLNRYSLVLT